ncbi:YceI family protein [soil metagenome]
MSTTTWILDPTHSEVQFKIKHLMISTVTGQFNNFSGSIETEGDDFSKARIKFSAEIASISTNNEQRDEHLKNGDFFNAAKYPELSFEGTNMEKNGEDRFTVTGTLTMKGISKEVSLGVEYGGIAVDPWGNTRSGFAVTGKIKRSDFDVNFGMITETGNIALGEEVKLFANTEFVKQAVLQPA